MTAAVSTGGQFEVALLELVKPRLPVMQIIILNSVAAQASIAADRPLAAAD